MADPEIWRALLETGNPYVQQERQQKGLMGMMELESKRRSMDAEQQLRQLYSSGGPVSTEKVMSISPELGIKLQQAQNEQYLKSLQAQETKGKIDLQAADQAAAAAFPALVAYHDNIQRGMPEAQAREMFHAMNGKAVSDAAQSGATWLQSGASYDPKKVDPENVRALNARFGRFTPFDKLQQESQTEAMKTGYGMQLKGTPSVSDRTYIGPDGLPHLMPSQYLQPGGQPPVQSKINPYPVFTFDGKTYEGPEFMRMVIKEKDPAKKQRMEEIIDAGFKQQQEGTLTDPNAVMPKTKQELEIETARGKKKAELDVEEQAMSRKATNAYDMLPDPDRIRNLIKGSVSGDLEYWANRAGGVVGKSLEAGDMTGALKVIEGQMAETVAMFPGAQSDKELEARMKTIGNPSGEISADTRLKAFDEWQERMQKYAAQHADYDDTKLVDMVQNKKLTREQAMQIRKRRMSGSL